jgi:hypothetical protein
MDGVWLQDIERSRRSLRTSRRVRCFCGWLRFSGREGCPSFLTELHRDPEVDEEVKGPLAEDRQDVASCWPSRSTASRPNRLHMIRRAGD